MKEYCFLDSKKKETYRPIERWRWRWGRHSFWHNCKYRNDRPCYRVTEFDDEEESEKDEVSKREEDGEDKEWDDRKEDNKEDSDKEKDDDEGNDKEVEDDEEGDEAKGDKGEKTERMTKKKALGIQRRWSTC